MTEEEWLRSEEPTKMLEWLLAAKPYVLSERKLRLFAVGCISLDRSNDAYTTARGESVILDDYERDGNPFGVRDSAWAQNWARGGTHPALPHQETTAAMLREVFGNPWRPFIVSKPDPTICVTPHGHIRTVSRGVRPEDTWFPVAYGSGLGTLTIQGERGRSPHFLDPAILEWRERTIPRLAEAIYLKRAWERMPILADALEEAGCVSEWREQEIRHPMVMHCRGFKPCVQCTEDGCSYCGDGWVEDWWMRTPSPTPPLRVRGDWSLDCLLGKS